MWGMATGALVVDHPTHCRMREVGAVEGLEDNEGFNCPETQEAQINKGPRAPAPLVLGMEAVWAAAEVAGVNKGVDSRAASLRSRPAMRVCNLSIVLSASENLAKELDIVCVVAEVG